MSSKDSSFTGARPIPRGSKNQQQQPEESNENVFDSSSSSIAAQLLPPRSPLHTIADPSQMRRDPAGESSGLKRVDGADDKSGDLGLNHIPSVGKLGTVPGSVTPKVSSVRGKGQAQPESNSAQSTPASRSGVVKGLSLVGGSSNKGCQLSNGGRLGGLSSRVSRRFTIMNTDQAGPAMVDVPHFDLEEDPSFWKDHNVQVLIRIRPLNNTERVMQGYGRCLKQESPHSLVWLGHPETRFTFDHIAGETITQEELFRVAGLPMVDNCMSGYNSCIFAYGQTGSGKTYTMMGEIQELDSRLHEDCGITPRIFEYLFSRIKVEEESRRDAKLTFSCKCSFLEIYNEQITDLLEPTSTNLQLREDLKKGVYVENLTEHNVRTVKDVLQLLVQGAANRKIAATHMNSESSRSHSVFTCIIESRWENESMTHFRYGRLNLVDLAGSERQKSSGAEGGRLKEAANINRSLSTLGLVIMSLVDVAHGKNRHVPYRDSRLTFLLQDSLGGNSKTSVIANISPSLCSATETLSTLKFGQRAKLIQNNAKVNEDASGDVVVLQHHIQQLKDQLSNLMNQGFPEVHSHPLVQSNEQLNSSVFPNKCDPLEDKDARDLSAAKSKIKFLETALARSLEREKAAQSVVMRLEAEIEQMNHVVGSTSTSSDIGNETTSGNVGMDEHIQSNEDSKIEDTVCMLPTEVEKELSEARLLIEALESELLRMSEELHLINERNQQLMDKVGREKVEENPVLRSKKIFLEKDFHSKVENYFIDSYAGSKDATLKLKLDRVTRDLEEAQLLNRRYQENQVLEVYHQKDADRVLEQVEVETANTIIHLQEELNSLQVELNERLCTLTAENNALRDVIADKDDEMRHLSSQWERAALELTSFLLDGSRSLNQASVRVKGITGLFPQNSFNLGEQVERATKACMDKEQTILILQKSLEDAQRMAIEMREKFNSLRGATIALTEAEDPIRNGSNNPLEPREDAHDEKTIGVESLHDMENQIQQAHEDVEVYTKRSSVSTFQEVNSNDECQMKSLVRDGLLELNSRLALIQASMGKILELHGCPISSEDLMHSDEWESGSSSSDYSLSVSDDSVEDTGPSADVDSHGLYLSNTQELTEVNDLSKMSNEDDATLSVLVEELQKGLETFSKVYTAITAMIARSSSGKAAGNKSLLAVTVVEDHDANNQRENSKDGVVGTRQLLQSSEQCAHSQRLVTDDGQGDRVTSFITRFEEAYTTIKDADLMLNALVKANENAMQVTNRCKSEGMNLKSERDSLVEQVQKLESLLSSEEAGDEALEIGRETLIEIANSVYSLGDCFLNIESDLQGWFQGMYSDLLSMSKDVKDIVHLLRLLLDNICSDLMEKDFTSGVLIECLSDSLRRPIASNSLSPRLHLGEANICSPRFCLSNSGMNSIGNREAPEAETNPEIGEPLTALSSLNHENSTLKKELERKEVILKGLLFDFSLVQEAASNSKDIKDEINKLIVALGQSERELQVKKCELEDLQVQYQDAKNSLIETNDALSLTNVELEQADISLDTLSSQNTELTLQLKDLYHRYSEAEKQLEEQTEVIKGLENEILHLTTSSGERSLQSSGELENDTAMITEERDQLREEVSSLKKKIELAYALAEENEALATEARQDSEDNKVYAEQKEEEVKILEHSIEELERTVDVLEKKVHEMDEEVQNNRYDRSSLEVEVQALRLRLSTVENITENLDFEDLSLERTGTKIPRQVPKQWLDTQEAYKKIEGLEKTKTEQAKEIERMKEYISELVLHAEAQASQYQQKYKILESMVKDVKANPSSFASIAPMTEKTERSSSRPRGSSSPFRCISNLVHQMNVEKDHELSMARFRIEELEALSASKQKEVCMLNSRLAATENMTHDVIRDLLGLKLDLTNYASLLDQHQLQRLMEDAEQQSADTTKKEEEIFNLRKQMHNLINERDNCAMEINRRESEILAIQLTVEQLKERDQYLTMQNEMLKVDKTRLMSRLSEMEKIVDEMENQNAHRHLQRPTRDTHFRQGDNSNSSLTRRILQSEEVLSQVNNELAKYRRHNGNDRYKR